MRAIILFSHGSLLCGSGEALDSLAARMRAADETQMVEIGYLNYSEPSFEATFERCAQSGATEIVIAPYFLVAGKFVKYDLPPKIAAMQRRHPELQVRVADALGFHPLLADALTRCAERAAPIAEWRSRMNTARRYCRADVTCPLYGSRACRASHEGERT